ncbi:YciI family protein [Pseudonocardia sp. CA-107938]|uniref:YciI family protein n=1 Tax=Pseudonocardia sp. CA-107938 TaxID=3240021 RepID=UPI003D8A811E
MLNIYEPEGARSAGAPAQDMVALEKLNAEIEAAGAWVFSAGLHEPSASTVVRSTDGEALVTDGPFAEAKEYVGGIIVISAEDLDEALAWTRRMAELIAPMAIEVRPVEITR